MSRWAEVAHRKAVCSAMSMLIRHALSLLGIESELRLKGENVYAEDFYRMVVDGIEVEIDPELMRLLDMARSLGMIERTDAFRISVRLMRRRDTPLRSFKLNLAPPEVTAPESKPMAVAS